MMREQPWMGALVVAVCVAACGGQKPNGPDAGDGTGAADAGTDAGHHLHEDGGGGDLDAGTHDAGAEDAGTQDAGTQDAGAQDAGEGPDGGEEPDAGTDLDGGMGPDAGCGAEGSVFWSIKEQDWGWPVTGASGLPACATGNNAVDCDNVMVARFDDQASLAAFYQDELQALPPVINFNLAEVIVTYSCACNTMGHQMITHDVFADDCTVTTVTELEKPGETCWTQQTFTRPFSTVELTRTPAPNVRTLNSPTVYSCE